MLDMRLKSFATIDLVGLDLCDV